MRRIFFPAFVALVASCARNFSPEITWSLMHPTALDTVYMARVIEESASHRVDNFEICGGCNSGTSGSLDGLLYFEEYPLARAAQDSAIVAHNRKSLNRIVEMAHAAGKPVYYWHREVLCNEGMVKSMPELIDVEGEFDLLGDAYENFLRYKILKTFEAVPGLDGIVLTLTEASFSTIHNSSPDLYPPAEVVEKISRVFAEELQSRGKRFILRSFGSVAKDYEDICDGARLLASDYSFDVETKITPYDFSPFLEDNPYLQKIHGCTLSAECDALGEYLGAGRMSAEDVESIVRYVAFARNRGVDRFSIRLDRKGCNVFDEYPINVFAYEQAIAHPFISADKIRMKYYGARYPEKIARELSIISKEGAECVKRTLFAAGNVFFHETPTVARLKYIKAGGVLAAFASEGDMSMKSRQWGMLSSNDVPGRDSLLREKAEALRLAGDALARLESIRADVDSAEYLRLKDNLDCNLADACAMSELFKVICAYFDGIESGDLGGVAVNDAYAALKKNLEGLTPDRPVNALAKLFVDEYKAESAIRSSLSDAVDFVLPGCVYDQNRIEQYMHGAYPETIGGIPGVRVGNPVFPNGYIKVFLKPCGRSCKFRITGIGECEVLVNGKPFTISLSGQMSDSSAGLGTGFIDLPVSTVDYEIVIRKAPGRPFPFISAVSEEGDCQSFNFSHPLLGSETIPAVSRCGR